MSMLSSSRNWVCRNGFGRHCKGVEVVNFYATMSGLKRKEVEKGREEELPEVVTKIEKVEVETKKRVCGDCKTTITPLWRRRSGITGQQLLCNACGIRYRKRNKMQLNINEDSNTSTYESGSSSDYEGMKQRQKEKQMKMLVLLELEKKNKDTEEEKMKTMKKEPLAVGTKNTVSGKKEDEEAALLLLSLSSGAF